MQVFQLMTQILQVFGTLALVLYSYGMSMAMDLVLVFKANSRRSSPWHNFRAYSRYLSLPGRFLSTIISRNQAHRFQPA